MESTLWNNVNYKYPMKFCHNIFIREYDMSKANISSLLYAKKIDKNLYDYLYNADKPVREKYIGIMILKDPSIYQSIQDGIIEGKRRLFLNNNLKDSDILSIKNDAVFVIGKDLLYTEFDIFKFNCKNVYTMYIQSQDIEIYYGDELSLDGSLSVNLDIKGINDDLLPLHQPGMLDIISETCYLLQHDTIQHCILFLSDICNKYINLELPIEYYREFNYLSKYKVKTNIFSYYLDDINDKYKFQIDINRNFLILRDLLHIISTLLK